MLEWSTVSCTCRNFASLRYGLLAALRPTRPNRLRNERFRVGAAPTPIVMAIGCETMEGGPGPVANTLNQAMFARIPVNVVDATFEILGVFHCVFPESRLPNASFATALLRVTDNSFR